MFIFIFITTYILLFIKTIINMIFYTEITYGDDVYITLYSFLGNLFPSSHPKPVYIGNNQNILFYPNI